VLATGNEGTDGLDRHARRHLAGDVTAHAISHEKKT
jgi:hypothetical protein